MADTRDPMRVINARFKPFRREPELRSAEQSPGEMARADLARALERYTGPTIAGKLGDAAGMALDYGPIPAQIATEIAMQPVRAGEAVGKALHDPTLGNVTNAGAQSALALFQPGKAVGALAGGYGAALADDLGLFGGAAEAAGLTPDQEKQKALLQKKIGAQQWKSGAERRAVEDELKSLRDIEAAYTKDANANETKRKAAADEASQQEYNRAVVNAEGARDAELSRKRRFSETSVGKVYNQTGGAPALAMGLAGTFGMLDRLAKGAPKSTGDYARLGFEGFAGASLGNNAGLMYDALATDADNPERAAMLAYGRELPGGHPRKAWAEQAGAGMDKSNPIREAASAELYDPVKFAERMGMSMLEGVPMAWTGANIPGAIAGVGRGARGAARGTAEMLGDLPGDAVTSYHKGMGRAATAQGDAAILRQNALEAELGALEAQRRIGGQRAGAVPAGGAGSQALDDLPVNPPPERATSSSRPAASEAPTGNGRSVTPIGPDGNIALRPEMFDDLKPNKTYGANFSRKLQDYTIGQAERGIDPASKGKGGFNRAAAAREIGATPTMVKNATENLLGLSKGLGIDTRDPGMLRKLADALNKSPLKAKGGNVMWSAAPAAALAAGAGGDDMDPVALARALMNYGGR